MAAIANSLVFSADGEPLLVLTSGGHRVDTAKVAALLGVDQGRPSGRRSRPCRHRHGDRRGRPGRPRRTEIRTLVDVDLAEHDVVWAAAGHPRTVFPTTYDELVRITGGTPAEVA